MRHQASIISQQHRVPAQATESYLTPTIFRQILERIERLARHPRYRESNTRSDGNEEP
jgi:hypothetical protein